MDQLDGLFTLIGYVSAAVITGAGAALAVIKFAGESWISNKFAERLEGFKHTQQKELEHIRSSINFTFDRTIRLHEMQMKILPETWARLVDTYHKTKALVAWLRQVSDLDKLPVETFEEILKDSPLSVHFIHQQHADRVAPQIAR